MVGINKFTEKERRKQRRSFKVRNEIARDLHTPKYHQRVIERKRVDNEDGSYWFEDILEDDE